MRFFAWLPFRSRRSVPGKQNHRVREKKKERERGVGGEREKERERMKLHFLPFRRNAQIPLPFDPRLSKKKAVDSSDENKTFVAPVCKCLDVHQIIGGKKPIKLAESDIWVEVGNTWNSSISLSYCAKIFFFDQYRDWRFIVWYGVVEKSFCVMVRQLHSARHSILGECSLHGTQYM